MNKPNLLPKNIIELKNPLSGVEFSFNKHDLDRDSFMLKGNLAKEGYDRYWHHFTGYDDETGEAKTFFIEFVAVNPELGGSEPVFGLLESNRQQGRKPSYLMIKAGCWGEGAKQVHRFFGWKMVDVKEEAPFQISAENCFLSETRTLGRVSVSEGDAKAHPEYMSDAGEMVWDLKIDKKIAFNVGYGSGKIIRDIDALKMQKHSEGIKTWYSGKVYWNGRKYSVGPDRCYGYSDKVWGSEIYSPYINLSSDNLVSNRTGKELTDSVFAIQSGQAKDNDDRLIGAFYYEGTPYEFNFSKFWTMTRTKFAVKDGSDKFQFKVIMETPVSKLAVQVNCRKKEMLSLKYESPKGGIKLENIWSGGTASGTAKLYKKKISVKNKWEWELVDDIRISNAEIVYGK